MTFCMRFIVLFTFSNFIYYCDGELSRPNIVIIIADDLGWDDVSFHGSDLVITPNIDMLAYTGVALERYYTHCVCTPSRTALLTGKFAYTLGMHGYPLTNSEDRGLPLIQKIMPQYLKELGYATHLVGKWHLGQSRTAYLPTSRGFDTFFGHKGGSIDYYEYMSEETWSTGPVSGMDLTRNQTAAWDVEGYITDVYNEQAKLIINVHDASTPLLLVVGHSAPHSATSGALLQAPPEEVRALRYIESPERRIYSAMVKKLDDSVGDIFMTLYQKGVLNNTIIVFISDNGGMTETGISLNYASNWPLRGTKFSPFEGGVRVPAIVWSDSLKNHPTHLFKGKMHVVDWMPTLFNAIGANPLQNIDGINLWNSITTNNVTQRTEIFEIDDYIGFNSVTSGDYKLITGKVEKSYSNHQGGHFRGIIGKTPSYENSVKNSKVYAVVNEMGNHFPMKNINMRNKIRVHCKANASEKELRYPENGTVCLYNLNEDPCEIKDVSQASPLIVARLMSRLQEELKRTVIKPKLYRDPRSNPKLFNYTWSPWADSLDPLRNTLCFL